MDIYTLKSCDTCRKALKFLDQNNITYNNFDIRKDGISIQTIKNAIESLGWETVLNRRSTSWRQLDDEAKQNIDADKAAQLINDNPTLMKRPLLASNDTYFVGFDKKAPEKLLSFLNHE